MTDKPKRRYEVDIHIGADDLKSLKHAIDNISFDLERREEDAPINMVSGGVDTGYSVNAAVDTSITHDSWYISLEAYLAAMKAEEVADLDTKSL